MPLTRTDKARKAQGNKRQGVDHARPSGAASGTRGAGERLTVERLRHADGGLSTPLLREMLIIRKFRSRETPSRGPDPAGTGTRTGDSSRNGAKRSTAIRPPAPLPTHLFIFLEPILHKLLFRLAFSPHLPHLFSIFILLFDFLLSSLVFPRLTFFKRIFGLRPTHFKF